MALTLRAGLFLGLLFFAGLSPLGQPEVAAAQSGPAAEMFQLINQLRAEHGLPGFTYSGTLALAAQNHANWMAASGLYSHTGDAGSTPLSRAQAAGYNGGVSENIVGGTSMSPYQGLLWWRNSPTHYNTLVSVRYSEAGIGFASDGSQNFYVLVVGRPSNSPPAPLADRSAEQSAAPLLITPITLAEPREDGSIVHVIQQGQALWTIAAYYDVQLDYLYLINNFTEATILHPGNEVMVRLPDGASPPPTPTPPLSYTIQKGDSLWTIATKNDITVDFLVQLNNLGPNTVLHPGNELRVRLAEGEAPPPTATPVLNYIVQTGDSLWNIAALHGLTIDELMALNGLTADSVLYAGMELRVVPATATPPPAVAAATTPEAATEAPVATPSPTPTASNRPIRNPLRVPAAAASPPAVAGDANDATAMNVLGAAAGLALIAGLVVARNRSRGR